MEDNIEKIHSDRKERGTKLDKLQNEIDEIAEFFDNDPEKLAKAIHANRISRAAQIAYILKLEIENRRLKDESITDDLTGLTNRKGWNEFVEEYEEKRKKINEPVTVMVADLDNLKEINDRLGHDVGDNLLQESANLLQETSRKTDFVSKVVSRAGGDEFYLLLPSMNDDGANKFIERLENSIKEYNSKDQSQRNLPLDVQISISIGFEVVEDNEPIDQAIRKADEKMYEHKISKKAAEDEK
jgi:diguanylate cyclase (GGDEF)-like protein